MKEVLYATGQFEIGDQFYDEKGHLRTVTDVLVCHYLKRGSYKVLYEVDNNGEFIDLRLQGFGDLPTRPQQQPERQANRILHFHGFDNKSRPQDPFFGNNTPGEKR